MMNYIGCALFGVLFLVMTAQTNGSLQARMGQVLAWIHGWAPFSYLIILIMVGSAVVSIKTMQTWPKTVVPEDPMAKYRRQAAGLENAPGDAPED